MTSKEWTICKIRELCSSVSETYKRNDEKVILINTSDVFGGKILNNTSIENKNLKGQFKKTFKKDDILYSEIRPANRRFAYVDIDNTDNYIASTKLMVLRPNKNKVLSKYLYLILKSDEIIEDLQHLAETRSGTFPQITFNSELANIEILLPPLETQEKIARILSSLDDKIELNNKINQNLEQQAQAIFKSWFVDFEPFGGKMPEDWESGTISELGTVVGGSTPSKKNPEYYTNNGIAWITPKDLSRKNLKFISKGEIDITDKGFKNSSVTLIPKGTVLFSSRAPIGYISIAQNDVTTNQGFKSVIPFQTVGTPYVYLYLKKNITLIENMAAGSTFKEVSGSIMQNIPALIPSKETLKRFNLLCDTIFRKQEYLEIENEKLAQLRDTLLPKLMSGEIDVDKVEV